MRSDSDALDRWWNDEDWFTASQPTPTLLPSLRRYLVPAEPGVEELHIPIEKVKAELPILELGFDKYRVSAHQPGIEEFRIPSEELQPAPQLRELGLEKYRVPADEPGIEEFRIPAEKLEPELSIRELGLEKYRVPADEPGIEEFRFPTESLTTDLRHLVESETQRPDHSIGSLSRQSDQGVAATAGSHDEELDETVVRLWNRALKRFRA